MRIAGGVLAGFLIVTMTACAGPAASEVSGTVSSPAPGGGSAGQGGTSPAARESPVTWTTESLDEAWVRAPMTLRVTLPQRFRLTFSGAVDRDSVAEALHSNLGKDYQSDLAWQDDRRVTVTVKSGPFSDPWTFQRLTPEGGKDASGAVLPSRFEAILQFSVQPQTEVWRWTRGDRPALVATLPGPYDVLSASPDGRKLFLRRFGIPQAGGFPPVGPPPGWAFLYDVATKALTTVPEVHGWLSPQWLADGSLLVSGSFTPGATLVRVGPNGDTTVLVKNRSMADYEVSPDDRQVAVFLEPATAGSDSGTPGDVWLVDLASGRRREIKGAIVFGRSPNGVPEVSALWSPDSQTLVYGDKTGLPWDDSSLEYHLVALDAASGDRKVVLDKAGQPLSWSPDGRYLLARNTGVLDLRTGSVVLKSSSFFGGFSPNADRLFLAQEGLVSESAWDPVGRTPDGMLQADWAPGGQFVALSRADGAWAVVQGDNGETVWSFTDHEASKGRPLWSPDGRFVAIPGVGIGDTRDMTFFKLDKNLGLPVGWNQSGALLLGVGRTLGDDDYVKSTR